MKLNLGCGNKKLKGYINVDTDKTINPDIILDITKPLPFKKNYFNEILLDNVVEHLNTGLTDILPEIKRVLKPNGILKIICPNCFFWKNRLLYLFGIFIASNGYHYDHRWLFKPSFLKNTLEQYGFDVKPVDDLFNRDVNIIARKRM